MVRPIPKDGRVVRLTKETLEGLLEYDSDPNIAFLKMMKKPAIPDTLITHSCRFDDVKIRTVVKEEMEKSALQPFMGGG